MSDPINFSVSSGYGGNTHEPFVEIVVEAKGFRTQMSPENARELAHNLLQAAEAAYSDAFIVEFMRDGIGAGEEIATVALIEFRKWRQTEQVW